MVRARTRAIGERRGYRKNEQVRERRQMRGENYKMQEIVIGAFRGNPFSELCKSERHYLRFALLDLTFYAKLLIFLNNQI